MTDQISGWASVSTLGKIRIAVTLVLLVMISYDMGARHDRRERCLNESSALKAQYDQVLAQYAISQAQHAQALKEYSELRTRYDRMEGHTAK